MRSAGYQIGNVDCTIILERPKIGFAVPEMERNIRELMHVREGGVNVKARTHERLGEVGEGRAIECHVVLTLVKDIEEEKK